MKAISLLLSLVIVVSAASIGLGIVDVNDLMENPSQELSEIGTNIQEYLSRGTETPDDQPGNTTPDTGETDNPETPETDETKTPDPTDKPWEQIDCNVDPLPNPPGYVELTPGWNPMDFEKNEENPYESYHLVSGAGDIFALGDHGSFLRLDSGFWTKVEANTSMSLNGMMLGSWPSYIVGDNGVIRSYSPVTGSIENFESPFDDMDLYDRPDLYTAFGTSHENFWILGDGVFYHYYKFPPSHPEYNASDPTPKWEYVGCPVSPASLRGPHDPYISDVWVHDYDTVFILVMSAGHQTLHEWDGNDWIEHDELPTNSLIRDIWGLGPSDMFAIGVGGTILHYDGFDWRPFNDTGLDRWNSYSAIWGTSKNNLYAVGDSSPTSSQLMHYDGEYWRGMDIPTDNSLSSILGWGESIESVYFTSYEGEIFHYVTAVAGQGEDLTWYTLESEFQPSYQDHAVDGSQIFIAGQYWPIGTDGKNVIYHVGAGQNFKRYEVKTEGETIYCKAVAVNDNNIYTTGWDRTYITYICRMNKDGSDANFFYQTFPDANVSLQKLAVDDEGNTYLAAMIGGSFNGETYSGFHEPPPEDLGYTPYAWDALVIKYSPEGELLWSKMFGSPETKHYPWGNLIGERIKKIMIDENGDIIIIGFALTNPGFTIGEENSLTVSPDSTNEAGTGDYVFIIKMKPDGTPIAAKSWSPYSSYMDIEETSDGYIFTGNTDFAETSDGIVDTNKKNIMVMKLDESLNTIWTRYIAYSGHQWFRDSAVGNDGNIYITGLTMSSVGGHRYIGKGDIMVLKISDDGVLQGTKLLGGTDRDEGLFIYLDEYGYPNIFSVIKSTDVYGYKDDSAAVHWEHIDMPTDPYAECRLKYR